MAWNPSLVRHSRNMKSLLAVPAVHLRIFTSSTRAYVLRNEAKTLPVMNAGTLHTVTRILRVPMYSGCSGKNLVAMLFAATLAVRSSVGIRTSDVVKLLRQKYSQETPVVRHRSSKLSFLSSTNLLDLRSVMTISGMAKISFPLMNSA